jgi:hypothetical protein
MKKFFEYILTGIIISIIIFLLLAFCAFPILLGLIYSPWYYLLVIPNIGIAGGVIHYNIEEV